MPVKSATSYGSPTYTDTMPFEDAYIPSKDNSADTSIVGRIKRIDNNVSLAYSKCVSIMEFLVKNDREETSAPIPDMSVNCMRDELIMIELTTKNLNEVLTAIIAALGVD